MCLMIFLVGFVWIFDNFFGEFFFFFFETCMIEVRIHNFFFFFVMFIYMLMIFLMGFVYVFDKFFG
jgi:hypothetical protein